MTSNVTSRAIVCFQEVEILPPQKKSKKKPPPPRAPSGSPMVTTTTQVPSKPQTRVVPSVTASTPGAESNTSTVTAGNSVSAISSTKAEADALPSQDSSVQSSVVPPSVPTKVKLSVKLWNGGVAFPSFS